MPKFDGSHYDPPAPTADVILRAISGRTATVDVILQIDTGADITLLPRDAVDRLGVSANPDEQFELVGFDGSRSTAPVVELEMIFLRKAFRGKYLLVEGERGVLGRDVLAAVVVVFDGPRTEWSELPQPGSVGRQ